MTGKTGIAFVHYDGGSGQKYIIETVTNGLAMIDYDGDGDEDIYFLYFLNGAPLRGSKADRTPSDALYRNDGGWRFTDVTKEAGLVDAGFARRCRRRLRQRRRPRSVRRKLCQVHIRESQNRLGEGIPHLH